MRILGLLLLLIGASFAIIEGYAMAVPEQAPAQEPSGSCGSPPPMKDGTLDQDWCADPPDLVAFLARRFAPRTHLLDHPVRASAALGDATVAVPPLPEAQREDARRSTRQAPFEWRAGAAMLLVHGDQRLCLCRPGQPLDASAMAACGAGWIAHRAGPDGALLCGRKDGTGMLLLAPQGGTIRFHALGGESSVAQPEG
ncbi:hypothetical protein ABIC65_003211 [Sphingomonas trueperi]|uniref:hypothetical protein n=1 Tax=Sphingomonas trueperi TaxID=53317 RepID=UPI0033984C2C